MANIINFVSWLIPLCVVAGGVYYIFRQNLLAVKSRYEKDLSARESEMAEFRSEASELLSRYDAAASEAAKVIGLTARIDELTSDLADERARLQGVASIDEAIRDVLLKTSNEVADARRELSNQEIQNNELVASLRLEIASLNEIIRQRDTQLAEADRFAKQQALSLLKVSEDYQEAVDRLRTYSSASLVIKRGKGVRASGVLVQNRSDLNSISA